MDILNIIVFFENFFIIKILELLIPKIKISYLFSLLVTFVLTLENFLLSMTEIGENEKLLFPMLTLIVFCTFKHIKIFESLLKVCIIFLNLTLIKFFVIVVSTVIIESDFQSLFNNYTVMYTLTCISIIVLAIEYVFLRNYYSSTYQLSKYSIIILSLSFIITFIVINIILREYVLNRLPFFLCIIFVIVLDIFLFLVTILCISNAKYYEKNLEQSLRLEALSYEDKYINAITEKTIEYNKLRHDMKNHFGILEKMIKDSHIKEAENYMKKISFDDDSYVHINHLVLNYLLSSKIKYAKSHNINLCCLITGKPLMFISDIDYNILVGNLLDNAIEATIEASSHEINVSLTFYQYKFVVEVKNTFIKKPDTKRLFTTKKDKNKHGLGLKNIKAIVDKYNGQDIIEIDDNVFYHMCILYKVG